MRLGRIDGGHREFQHRGLPAAKSCQFQTADACVRPGVIDAGQHRRLLGLIEGVDRHHPARIEGLGAETEGRDDIGAEVHDQD